MVRMASAADIITYAGIPLAVIGVLPSLYTFFKSFVTLRDIRRMLSDNGISAITRGSMLSGIVEVEIPRKSITPLDRDDPAYFDLSEYPSHVKGGSFTIFNWRELVIGSKAYRLQYHDELAQPQAEVDLESLVAYLLDLGAVPDPQGFTDLRNSGLWTPNATRLLTSPDGKYAVLSIAGAEDSEGMLSLKLDWRREWSVRGPGDLPPYWMRLQGDRDDMGALGILKNKEVEKQDSKDTENKEKRASGVDEKPQIIVSEHLLLPGDPVHHQDHSSSQPQTGTSENQTLTEKPRRLSMISHATSRYSHYPTGTLRLKLSMSGVDEIINEDYPKRKMRPRYLRQTHINEGFNSTALWFACAATSLAAPRGGLWSFGIPPAITTFSLLETIPCGILELWGFMTAEQTPVWRTPYDDSLDRIEQRKRDEMKRARMMEETRLKGPAWHEAVHKRFREEHRERTFEEERKKVEEQKRASQEMVEALGSSRLGIRPVAEAARRWLTEKQLVGDNEGFPEIVERLLWEMVTKQEVAIEIVRVLDEWKHWSDNGGMTQKQYDQMKDSLITFAYASCIIYLIADTAEAMSGSVVSDLQECMRLWKRVRLG